MSDIYRYKIDRTLYHWEKEDHKYIAKIKRPNGKWRYFYSQEEYQAYLDNQKKDQTFDPFGFIGSFLETAINAITKTLSPLVDAGRKFVENTASSISDISNAAVSAGQQFVSNLVGDSNDSNVTNADYMYIAKVETNGYTRYFYDQAEYDAYLERQAYQANEPDFMKDIREIPDDEYPTDEENMETINEDYFTDLSNGSYEHTLNCMNCTTAYELRCRGYDVEADVMKLDNTSLSAMDKFYVDPIVETLDSSDVSNMDSVIAQKSGENSRGNLMVYWSSGGGHSMAYEVESDGSLTIYDTQVNRTFSNDPNKRTSPEYTLDYLTDNISNGYFARTDNLELAEGVLSAVVENND